VPRRSAALTLANLRLIAGRLEQNSDSYDAVALAELKRILDRRIAELVGDLLPPESSKDEPAAVCKQP
jgi:hypothetical protein